MKNTIHSIAIFSTALCVLALSACGEATDLSACKAETNGWSSMQEVQISLRAADSVQNLTVRIADDASERAAGYQWICPAAARDTAVLFVFPQAFLAAFHMRNVYVPLNIAFFDAEGYLVDSLLMASEPPDAVKKGQYYKARAVFQYALEVPQSVFSTELLNQKSLRLVLSPAPSSM